ncbi:TetR/AcrR family transcriptional regulator [Winogradskyella maritima]|uniref:TetR/AcrR family transcriptional regulator n=1 Tax=Winogradskyella maritima TaxID=1517766 RepID=A0ABV8AKF6_9FLAO|nr:TetR/AcrR family transcriptional regulator [Winogradskyella maritima]
MQNLPVHITIDSALYTKDPNSSKLGQNIVSHSIDMIDELGFEAFTFKKLGTRIGSNESSIYRYFESKHVLLVYLISWYWSWVEYTMVFSTSNIASPVERLEKCIYILTRKIDKDNDFSYINEINLGNIIISESSKAYHTKAVDKENKLGYFKTYKRVVQRVSDIVLEINPTYDFPHMLISTVIEGAHQQRYFSEHLPSLTDVKKGKDTVVNFYTHLVFRAIT